METHRDSTPVTTGTRFYSTFDVPFSNYITLRSFHLKGPFFWILRYMFQVMMTPTTTTITYCNERTQDRRSVIQFTKCMRLRKSVVVVGYSIRHNKSSQTSTPLAPCLVIPRNEFQCDSSPDLQFISQERSYRVRPLIWRKSVRDAVVSFGEISSIVVVGKTPFSLTPLISGRDVSENIGYPNM